MRKRKSDQLAVSDLVLKQGPAAIYINSIPPEIQFHIFSLLSDDPHPFWRFPWLVNAGIKFVIAFRFHFIVSTQRQCPSK